MNINMGFTTHEYKRLFRVEKKQNNKKKKKKNTVMLKFCGIMYFDFVFEITGYKLVRLLLPSVVTVPYLASAETVCDLLLPAENAIRKKWLPVENVRVILILRTVSAENHFSSTQ